MNFRKYLQHASNNSLGDYYSDTEQSDTNKNADCIDYDSEESNNSD